MGSAQPLTLQQGDKYDAVCEKHPGKEFWMCRSSGGGEYDITAACSSERFHSLPQINELTQTGDSCVDPQWVHLSKIPVH